MWGGVYTNEHEHYGFSSTHSLRFTCGYQLHPCPALQLNGWPRPKGGCIGLLPLANSLVLSDYIRASVHLNQNVYNTC